MMDRWPYAGGEADKLPGAAYKRRPEDFRVTELLGFEPAGEGEHLLVFIEKTNLTSRDAARHLAGKFGLPEREIGLAGMKDKRAITRQWFSLPHSGSIAPGLLWEEDDRNLQIVDSHRHTHKIRRGQLAGNRFELRLCELTERVAPAALEQLERQGVPNYFGPQRFGRDNLEMARSWLSVRRSKRISAFKKGLYLSVLRSFLFNEILAARVRAGNWHELIAGDMAEAQAPTGPLWGRGRSATGGLAAQIESQALAEHEQLLEDLEYAGVQQQRRSLRHMPAALRWQQPATDELLLSFELPPGAYATVLLRELVKLQPLREMASLKMLPGAETDEPARQEIPS
jgi:tRNA pseudouridine13 synthase